MMRGKLFYIGYSDYKSLIDFGRRTPIGRVQNCFFYVCLFIRLRLIGIIDAFNYISYFTSLRLQDIHTYIHTTHALSPKG
jgi:hypothetical protein